MAKMVISDVPDPEYVGKRVFVRVDFNVPILDGQIREDYRIRRTIPTIDYLVERGARLIIATHLGRPMGRRVASLSVGPVANRLSELLGKSVKFLGKTIGEDVKRSVAELQNGEVMLLENLRFHLEERENTPEFSKELASLADIYVNDAFGTSHRSHASTYGMAKYFELRLAGFLVNWELNTFAKVRESPERPYIVIVGGSKIRDKINAVKNFLEIADKVLLGGGVAYTFLKAKGVNVGTSIIEDDGMVEWAAEALKSYRHKIYLPIDHVVAESMQGGKNSMCMIVDDEIPDEYRGFDIGPKTVARYISQIKGEGNIFWNGPMGVFELDAFSSGTTHIARAVALATLRGATTVVGGGETVAALRKAEVLDSEISHISTGGGSLLVFLNGEELPGISILNESEV
ncbi:MAG: phosphoglycerate kinase [Candidatus Dadabacteria bacterium]|nr:phosphoglycerate kinase [Candidatus Dadabacteria bacterium]